LYRAGLALQAVTPNWSRARVTLFTGAVTTIIACFPFVFTGLLNFVGIYGLLLAPAGAIVLTEHWIFPRIGLTRYWASQRGGMLNGPALISWAAAIGVGLALERAGVLHLFYLFIPVYALTSVLYIALAWFWGARKAYPAGPPEPVPVHSPTEQSAQPQEGSNPLLKWASGLVALASLVISVAVPLSVAFAGMDGFALRHEAMKSWLTVAMLVYFASGTVFYHCWEKEKGRA
jgi:NCS1 family nucleobase:cation symporter-1